MVRENFDYNKYLPMIKALQGKSIPWPMGYSEGQYPQYSLEVLGFADGFFKSKDYDKNYDRVMRRNGYYQGVNEEELKRVIEISDDEELVRALVSAIIRQERYTPGTWSALLENGILYQLLAKLAQMPIK